MEKQITETQVKDEDELQCKQKKMTDLLMEKRRIQEDELRNVSEDHMQKWEHAQNGESTVWQKKLGP